MWLISKQSTKPSEHTPTVYSKSMFKNQKGFSHVIIPVCLLAIVIIVGVFAWSRIALTNNSGGKGWYAAKNYSLSFEGKSDDTYSYQYSIDVLYDDSFDPKSDCPARLTSFRGSLNIEYPSDSTAKVNVLQNVEPYKKQDSDSSVGICPAVVVPPATETVRLDKKWLESGTTSKKVLMNDKTYAVELNKQNRTLSFNGENYKRTQPYLPDGLTQLYAYPMYQNCMSTVQIQAYAQEHNIATADSRYPGLTANIKAIPNLKLEAPDGSENMLLVIADDHVKQLIEKTQNERGAQDTCRVVASKPTYTFVSQ